MNYVVLQLTFVQLPRYNYVVDAQCLDRSRCIPYLILILDSNGNLKPRGLVSCSPREYDRVRNGSCSAQCVQMQI